jgi:pyruvate formate lyase activating enzyme
MTDPALTRRQLIGRAVRYGGALAGAGLLLSQTDLWRLLLPEKEKPGSEPGLGKALADDQLRELIKNSHPARYWVSTETAGAACTACHKPADIEGETEHEHEKVKIKCQLCAGGCVLGEGERGACHARIHVKGELRTLVYGRPITIHVDPIEKKPFYHFLPGRSAYSLSTSGCPLRCKFCQNWQISQAAPEDYSTPFLGPAKIVSQARSRSSPIIAYTYNEPTVFTEYLTDIAREARPRGVRSVLVSCGFMTEAPLTEMCQVLDGIKIDLKGFSKDFYRKVCGAELEPVLRSIKQVGRSGVHLEIVNLVVPTLNDSDGMLKELAKWVVDEVGPDVPVHFTRFHPDYQLRNLPPTPTATLERARAIAMDAGIRYAFVGNVPGHPGNHTYCPNCGKIVIKRSDFFVEEIHIVSGRCEYCGEKIAGVWS